MADHDGTIFDRDEFKKYKPAWSARQKELIRRRSYYDGSLYNSINKQLGWLKFRVGKDIKPLFLPLARAVDVDAGIIPGGWEMGNEDLPESQVEGWVEARDFLFKASRWDTEGVLFIHYGAQYGVVGLKTSFRQDEPEVRVKPVDPLDFMLILGPNDVVLMSIYTTTRMVGEDEVEFAEVITPELVRTFLDGKPWASDDVPEWPNLLEEVPYIEVRHMETGAKLGESTYQKAMPLLDEVNKHATELSKIIEDSSEPQWAVIGAEPSDLEHGADNVWFIPEGGDVKILLPQIDIDGILAFINEIKDGVKEALPELSFDELRAKEQIAAKTIGLQLIELILKIQRVRPNYDEGLRRALQMAGRAGAIVGVPELAVLDDEELTFDENREILPMDPSTRIELEMQRLALEQMENPPPPMLTPPVDETDEDDTDEDDTTEEV